MSGSSVPVDRVEGALTLLQDDAGAIRLQTPATRDVEGQLSGRSAVEAIYLTQQIGADSGVAHALAAALALEAAAGLTPPPNGLVLRDLLHCCATLHAHVRHFYGQVLPDYLPLAALGGYRGSWPHLQRIAGSLRDKSSGAWARQAFAHPYNSAQVDRLAESSLRSLETLAGLQQMLALLGGKFPMTMSIVPGGCGVPVTEELLLALRLKLEPLRPFLEHGVYQDALLVLGQYPHARTWGSAGQTLVCAGTPGPAGGPAAQVAQAGVWLEGRLEPYGPGLSESIAHSAYRVPLRSPGGQPTVPAPEKAGAASWIKAPRTRRRPATAGALARLVMAQASAPQSAAADAASDVEGAVGAPLAAHNAVAGRLLAGMAEVGVLVSRCLALLAAAKPGELAAAATPRQLAVSGEGVGDVEAPAGALRHRVTLERGKIVRYDIISPSTWNGSPADQDGQTGPLLTALNGASLDLSERESRLVASRIVHSFFFSQTDAVQ